MKTIKMPLETRYQELKVVVTCTNKDCGAELEAVGKEVRGYRKGNLQDYREYARPQVCCPYCGRLLYVNLEDNQLELYIMRQKPAYI